MQESQSVDPSLLLAILAFIIIFIPMQKVFSKAGFSRAWAFLLVLGPVGVFICWMILAVRQWPSGEEE